MAGIYYFSKDPFELFASNCPSLTNREYGVFVPYHKYLKRDALYGYLEQNKLKFVKNCKWYGKRYLAEERIIYPEKLLDVYNKNYKVQKELVELLPQENVQTGVLIPGFLDFAAAKQAIHKIQENVISTKTFNFTYEFYSQALDSESGTMAMQKYTNEEIKPLDTDYLPSVVTSQF